MTSIDPRDLAGEPLHLPRRDDNPVIYDLILELLADHGVPAPHRAPAVASLAAVVQHVAVGNSWTILTAAPASYAVAGTIARPLNLTSARKVHLEAVWHKDASPRDPGPHRPAPAQQGDLPHERRGTGVGGAAQGKEELPT